MVVKCLHDHLADDAEFVKMFLDEARLAAHLDHSNIVQTMELGEHDGRYYMVMEFLAGLSLAMIVRRVAERLPGTRIPVPLVLNILAQASAGLHYAHEKAMNGKALNIVHRDISPQNLVISFEGVVKLVDFGIAKAELRETRTRSGTIKGKFAYMSPEQCVANNVDRRTDVFALGVIGARAADRPAAVQAATSPYETYQAVMACDVEPPSRVDPAIDPALDQVIMRALDEGASDDRYPTAEAFGDALLGYLHHRGIGSGPGDVSRFFDAHFGQEIEEHSGRMRELINGRDVSVDTGVSWGTGDDGRDSDPSMSGQGVQSAGSSSELTASRRVSGPSFELVHDDLGSGSRGEADDEMPAERTRIETNPLERVNELERLAARGPGPHADGPTQLAPSSAVPVPPPPRGIEAAAASPGTSGSPSGRFPNLANLPTVIAGAEPMVVTPPPSPVPPLPSPGPAAALPAHARTQIVQLPPGASGAPPGAAQGPAQGPAAGRPAAGRPAAGPPNGARLPAGAVPSPRPQSGSPPAPLAQDAPPPGVPGGYPVMNAQLSAQIATGATVFPSEPPRTGAPHAGPSGSAAPGSGMPPGPPGSGMQPGSEMQPGPPGSGMPMGPSGSGMPMGPSGSGMQSGPPGSGMPMGPSGSGMPMGPSGSGMQSGPPGSGMPMGPSGPGMQSGPPGSGMPMGPPGSAMPHGSGMPMGPPGSAMPHGSGMPPGPPGPGPRGSEPGVAPGMSGGYPMSPDGRAFDPQHAADLMSPVGQQYPENVDWDAAAAGRARAVPPWMLAVLFIGAIGIALALTIVVARLIH